MVLWERRMQRQKRRKIPNVLISDSPDDLDIGGGRQIINNNSVRECQSGELRVVLYAVKSLWASRKETSHVLYTTWVSEVSFFSWMGTGGDIAVFSWGWGMKPGHFLFLDGWLRQLRELLREWIAESDMTDSSLCKFNSLEGSVEMCWDYLCVTCHRSTCICVIAMMSSQRFDTSTRDM